MAENHEKRLLNKQIQVYRFWISYKIYKKKKLLWFYVNEQFVNGAVSGVKILFKEFFIYQF